MADSITSLTQLQTLLADNNSKNISPQDLRDWLVSCHLRNCTTTAANYSATSNDVAIILDAFSSAISLTLPTCTAGNAGQMYAVKAINAGTNKPYITNNVDGAAWTFGSSNESLVSVSDGTNWRQIATTKYPISIFTSPADYTCPNGSITAAYTQNLILNRGGFVAIDFTAALTPKTTTAINGNEYISLYIDGASVSGLWFTKLGMTTSVANLECWPFALTAGKTLAAGTHSITVNRSGGGVATYPFGLEYMRLKIIASDLG